MNETVPAWWWWALFAGACVALALCELWRRMFLRCRRLLLRERALRAELERARDDLYAAQVGDRFALATEKRAVLLEAVSVMDVDPDGDE